MTEPPLKAWGSKARTKAKYRTDVPECNQTASCTLSGYAPTHLWDTSQLPLELFATYMR